MLHFRVFESAAGVLRKRAIGLQNWHASIRLHMPVKEIVVYFISCSCVDVYELIPECRLLLFACALRWPFPKSRAQCQRKQRQLLQPPQMRSKLT